jgi:hypothetical protein
MRLRNRILRRSAAEEQEVSGEADAAASPASPEEAPATAVTEATSPPPPAAAPSDDGTFAPAIEESPGSAAAVDAPPPAPAGDDLAAAQAGDEQATAIQPAATEPADAPAQAGDATGAAPRKPGFRERGRMRRRLRYLREVRELGFRDLGGLVFDQHRFQRPNEALVEGKVAAIDQIDRETRALGAALGERKDYSELFVAGVSACQRCGTLHGSEARYCPHCGLAFSGPRFLAGVGAGDEVGGGEAPTTPGQAALFDPQARAAEDAADAEPAADPQAHDATP